MGEDDISLPFITHGPETVIWFYPMPRLPKMHANLIPGKGGDGKYLVNCIIDFFTIHFNLY